MFDPGSKRILIPRRAEVQNVQETTSTYSMAAVSMREQAMFSPNVTAVPDVMRRITAAIPKQQAAIARGDNTYLMNTPDGRLFREHYIHAIGSAHSHDVPVPFSAHDLGYLLSMQHHKLALLTDTNDLTSLLLPSDETQRINSAVEMNETVEKWIAALNERIQVIPPEQSIGANRFDINYRIQEAMIKSVAKKRKLAYYKGYQGNLERIV